MGLPCPVSRGWGWGHGPGFAVRCRGGYETRRPCRSTDRYAAAPSAAVQSHLFLFGNQRARWLPALVRSDLDHGRRPHRARTSPSTSSRSSADMSSASFFPFDALGSTTASHSGSDIGPRFDRALGHCSIRCVICSTRAADAAPHFRLMDRSWGGLAWLAPNATVRPLAPSHVAAERPPNATNAVTIALDWCLMATLRSVAQEVLDTAFMAPDESRQNGTGNERDADPRRQCRSHDRLRSHERTTAVRVKWRHRRPTPFINPDSHSPLLRHIDGRTTGPGRGPRPRRESRSAIHLRARADVIRVSVPSRTTA